MQITLRNIYTGCLWLYSLEDKIVEEGVMAKAPTWDDAPKRIREARWGYHVLKNYFRQNKKGYKILQMKDVRKEWDFILCRVDDYLSQSMVSNRALTPETYLKWNLSKVIVHFYHNPRDTEEPFILGNTKIIKKGFRILWVYNPSEACGKFETQLTECMGKKNLINCAFLKMDEILQHVPVNFTVIAPHYKELPLVYVRFEDLDFAIRIESRGPTVSLFDDLGCVCIKRTTDPMGESPNWIPLLEG